MVALDFRGAFDKVWWRGLIKHLWEVGIRSKEYKLFESYLLERSLVVVANGERSEEMEIGSGVPQGAIWSPLLFNLFVREVPDRVRNALSIFYADDLTLIRSFDDGERMLVKEELEEDLERLVQFGNEWLLHFEPKKTQGRTVSKKHDRWENPALFIDGTKVKEEEVIKVLGFKVDNKKGTWEKHIIIMQHQKLG